ncbi:MAG: hypothetical protein ABFD62_17385 [Syntrophaceae bacterium]
MLFRSTGLGKTELTAHIDQELGIECKGDYLILHVATTNPVRWKIRGAINYRDLLIIIKAALKFSVIKYLIWPFRAMKEPQHPGDF